VSFDRCRVEREHHGIFARFSQGFKDCAPSAALGPAIEAIVDRGVRAVFARTVAPSGAGLQHVNDAAEDAAVVVPTRPRQSSRQVRFNPCPLLIIQPKQTATHRSPSNQNMQTRESRGANQVQTLALQLLLLRASESMGNHDSNVVGAGRVG
jgi:hypothetical protein